MIKLMDCPNPDALKLSQCVSHFKLQINFGVNPKVETPLFAATVAAAALQL